MWLVYVLCVRLGGGAWLVSVVSICLVCETWGRGMVGQCGCVYVLCVRLGGGAWLVSVVSICLVCETWGRGMVGQCG